MRVLKFVELVVLKIFQEIREGKGRRRRIKNKGKVLVTKRYFSTIGGFYGLGSFKNERKVRKKKRKTRSSSRKVLYSTTEIREKFFK